VPRSIRGLAAAVTILVASVFAAGAGAQGLPAAQVQLTTGAVEAFIASYPEVRQTADGLEEQYGARADNGDDPMAAWQGWMAVSGAQSALNGVCQAYGFDGFLPWLQVMASVATAYTFVREGGGVDEEMAASIAEIQNNPNLSVAQKQMLLQQMQAAMGAVNAMRPSQENLDAVAPYADQLAVLFEDA
jgi:hypothetical protein